MALKRSLNEALLVDALKAKFGESILETEISQGEVTHTVNGAKLPDICAFLRDDSQYRFNFLSDMHATDNNCGAPRFEVVYHLYSIPKQHRLRLKVMVNERESVPTVSSIWNSADWAEREAYDMIGITFDGHPNMTRIYMPSGWDGHPLRKDYPLRGYKDEYNPFGEEKKQ